MLYSSVGSDPTLALGASVTEGAISTGTLRCADLCNAMFSELRTLAPERAALIESTFGTCLDCILCDFEPEQDCYENCGEWPELEGELDAELQRLAPPGMFFGVLDDPTMIGFWRKEGTEGGGYALQQRWL